MTFRLKTIIGISIIQCIMLLILVFSSVKFISDSNEQRLIARANASVHMFSNAIKDSILNNQYDKVASLMDDFITLEKICYIRIFREDGSLIVEGGPKLHEVANPDSSILHNASDGTYDVILPIITNDKTLGKVEIGFGTHGENTFLSQAKSWIYAIASIELIFVIGLSFLLGNALTRNLHKLKKAVNTVASQGPGAQVDISSIGDLGDVAQAFNNMSLKLEQNYQDLQQARNEAEAANKSKSRFLASMSHEIRTPMNAVLGLLAILKDTTLKPNQKELVNTATDSSELLLSIINDILDFSRMEANTFYLENHIFNIHKSLNSVLKTFHPQAQNKQLELSLFIADNVPTYVQGDAHRLRQILLNLVGNSLKFTDDGQVQILVNAEEHEGRIQLHCSVQDSGIGIQQEQLEYLFDEFTMADNSFSRTHEGSGLGLAICQRLVHMMDGTITVNSQYGLGSEFSFNIQLDKATTKEINYLLSKEKIEQQKDIEQQKNCVFSDANILVVEDNHANQIVIKNTLNYAGYSIDIAQNGKEAITKAINTQYDLIFMDISMPEMDGMTATKKIRSLSDTHQNMPIIALTAHALSGDKERFIEAGMTDYLSKPFNRSDLLECLAKYLFKQGKQDPSFCQECDLCEFNESTEEPKSMDNELLLVDEQIIQQIIADTDASVMPELIRFYIIESKERVETISNAAKNKDLYALEFEAHTLGSSALTLGNVALSTLAREIEIHCINQQFDDALEKTAHLPDLATLSLDALEKRNKQGFSK
ncbi:two-component hybrid sensor histidine kinase [Aliivibrio fischeri ES114]|uniref:histidine kinase n=1 Tax=Aliivibrio fischeri (strain ATCC 700601 / ES114) TaxID=312309 RepID=Q5DYQ1_ALIF1|nr:response regulator [Aliivibrio fischeri]AAW88095.1 two-component hybrid sensor histidine kinase [Aliivibrio fischeri ES114]KLU80569.1 chemotaxis protein CheY [Aliivibrio fischeri]